MGLQDINSHAYSMLGGAQVGHFTPGCISYSHPPVHAPSAAAEGATFFSQYPLCSCKCPNRCARGHKSPISISCRSCLLLPQLCDGFAILSNTPNLRVLRHSLRKDSSGKSECGVWGGCGGGMYGGQCVKSTSTRLSLCFGISSNRFTRAAPLESNASGSCDQRLNAST